MRLFVYRKAQEWPPAVIKQTGWNGLYTEQSSGLPVLQSVEEAIDWANSFIKRIDEAI